MRNVATIGAVLSLLVLAAHFLRAGHLLLVLVLALAPLLLLTSRPWALRVLQVVLVLGALEWLRTLMVLLAARLQAGEPALRMALILSVVAAVSVTSAAGLSPRSATKERSLPAGPSEEQGT